MRKLEELKELAESINEVLRFYRLALDDTKRTIDEKNETIKTLSAKLDNRNAEVELLKATIERQPLVVDIDSYRESIDEQKKEVERMELEVSRKNLVIIELKEKIAKLEEDSETLKVDNLILQEKAASLEKDNELMSRDVDSLWRKKVALEDENKALKDENETLKKKVRIAYMTSNKPSISLNAEQAEIWNRALAKQAPQEDKPQILKQDVPYVEFLKANGFSSTETIKKHFGVSQQAVCAHLRRLIGLGIVVRSHEHISDARQTYGINPDAPEYSVKRRKEAERKTPSISKLEESYLGFIKGSQKPVTTKEVCEHFGAGKSTSLYHLKKLRNKGLIAAIGPGSNRTYAAVDGVKYSIKRRKAPRRRKSAKNGKTSVSRKGAPQNAE